MDRHAYLIIAHNEPDILITLLDMLDDMRNDIFLHIDKRAVTLFEVIRGYKPKYSSLIVLENAISVYWGDISQVHVEYMLFERAFSQGIYTYYHLLSGVDLPIKSQDYIHAFFKENEGKEFVGFWTDAVHRRDLNRKVYRYYLFTRYLKGGKPFVHGVCSLSRNIFLALQKITQYKRNQGNIVFQKGFQWVSITQDFCAYLLSQKEQVLHRFCYTLCPDEIFIPTVLWNSPFREHVYSMETALKGSMRYIDWERGNPYVWQEKDVNELLDSPYLFARKFSSKNRSVISLINDKIKGI